MVLPVSFCRGKDIRPGYNLVIVLKYFALLFIPYNMF